MRRTAITALLVVCGLLSCLNQAQARGHGRSWQKWWHSPQVIRDLHLTAGEQARLDRIHLQLKQKEVNKRGRIKAIRMEIDALMNQSVVNEGKVNILTQKAARIRASIDQDRYHFLLQVRKLLGNARYQKLKNLYRDFKGR
jgi:Spy/CpxP family protein refolding chaperone